MTEEPPKGTSPGSNRAANHASLPRVLVVDDVADAAASLARLLRMLNCEVQIASNGETALSVASDFKPDIVLLDIGLPGLDGIQVAKRLREDTSTSETRIVALSGYGHAAAHQQSIEAGCDQHLVKPIRVEELEKLLDLSRRSIAPRQR